MADVLSRLALEEPKEFLFWRLVLERCRKVGVFGNEIIEELPVFKLPLLIFQYLLHNGI